MHVFSANQCKSKFAWLLSEECLPNRDSNDDKFPHVLTDNNIWTKAYLFYLLQWYVPFNFRHVYFIDFKGNILDLSRNTLFCLVCLTIANYALCQTFFFLGFQALYAFIDVWPKVSPKKRDKSAWIQYEHLGHICFKITVSRGRIWV